MFLRRHSFSFVFALALFAPGPGVLSPGAVRAQSPVPVAAFDFDDGHGGPDAQGWTPHNRSADGSTHFHVEDFSGAGHEAFALEGGRSMWCGATVEDSLTCAWEAPPGYGSDWNENLASVPFPVTGDVTLSFLADYDLEPGYDYVFVQYADTAGAWVTLDTYSCGGGFGDCGPLSLSYTVPAAAHHGDLRFRFHFDSDPGVDSAHNHIYPGFHIAFVVDSLTVRDDTGPVDFQDFEAEAVGATATADGRWYAEPNTDLYSAGVLVSGETTLQETSPVNTSWFWAFLAGSDRDYACAGHPEQPVMLETVSLVRSPRIDLTRDREGRPVEGPADSVRVSLDVYRDIAETEQKFWSWVVRSYAGICELDVGGSNWIQGDQKDWYRASFTVPLPEGADGIVVDLVAGNYNFFENLCRSHAPLFDNVEVERFGGGVSAVSGPGPDSSTRLTGVTPNPFNPVTTIRFELREAGPVTLEVFDVAGRLVRTLVDGRRLPAGPGRALWRGEDDRGRAVASGTYFCRLEAGERTDVRSLTLLR